MKAIMYGGGNIGRGFIGALLSDAGYQVTFIDVAEQVVDRLHEQKCYPLRIIDSHGHQDLTIANVDAVNGNDTEAAARAIAEADIMATAVGAKILKFIAPNIAEGLKLRFQQTDRPLDIIICENLMDANKVLEKLIKEHLTPTEQALMDERVGLVEASIGRMVPIQTPEMQDGDPLRVCVEAYGYLPVDQAAFKGEIPNIKGMVPFAPFDFYIKRKLYLHNMGHAICAYLGGYVGRKYIWQSIDDPEILVIVQNAMLESAMALSKKYGVSFTQIAPHMIDLLGRFRNTALGDTCKRVGGDPTRKLQIEDRMIGSALLAMEQGITPAYIAAGIAGAIYRYLNEAGTEQSMDAAKKVLEDVAGLSAIHPLTELVLRTYPCFLEGETINNIRHVAETLKIEHQKDVV